MRRRLALASAALAVAVVLAAVGAWRWREGRFALSAPGLAGADAAPRWRREATRDPGGPGRRFVDHGPFAVSGLLCWRGAGTGPGRLELALVLDQRALRGHVAASFDHFQDRGLHWFTLPTASCRRARWC